MAIPLSFSVKSASPGARLFIVVFGLLGVLGPVAYFGWWGLSGGSDWEVRHGIEKLVADDPARLASSAIGRGDYRLYCTGGLLDPVVPGVGYPHKAYAKTFGYKGFTIFDGPSPTDDQDRLNKRAIVFMTRFNEVVYDAVKNRFPDWIEQTKHEE